MGNGGLDRRTLIGGSIAAAAVMAGTGGATPTTGVPLYGSIGRFVAKPGQRDGLVAALLGGIEAMPGCLSYVVAHDPADADGIWITEVWDSKASHDASLSLPAVRAAIARGRPLIAGMDNSHETIPISGIGLAGRIAG